MKMPYMKLLLFIIDFRSHGNNPPKTANQLRHFSIPLHYVSTTASSPTWIGSVVIGSPNSIGS